MQPLQLHYRIRYIQRRQVRCIDDKPHILHPSARQARCGPRRSDYAVLPLTHHANIDSAPDDTGSIPFDIRPRQRQCQHLRRCQWTMGQWKAGKPHRMGPDRVGGAGNNSRVEDLGGETSGRAGLYRDG